ncbi:MAG TPA: D-alanyl-D-alanine carboxypeptidase [Acidimicrobiales bacterium]|nr:D-alanyl-D-alanine carboxypeptidase [Acidimicrobiales bacterium]
MTAPVDLARLDELWSASPDRAVSCLLVTDGADVVFERNADVAVVPASVMKVVVASAALRAIEGAAVEEQVRAMLRESDNDAARAVGAEVGLGRVAAVLADAGHPVTGLVVRDATGHDRGNRVTCRLVAALLAGGDTVIAASLPVAGESGTLAHRLQGTDAAGRVRAKTGSISGVTALAGHADTPAGLLTFAHVLNGVASREQGEALHDRLALALVEGSRGPG